jgi:hypothetical protein
MKTEPFRPLLAAVLAGLLAGAGPALAGGQANDESSAPAAEAKPKIIKPQPKSDKPALPALHGLHLKLGNVELKVRGPVIIDAGPGDTGSSQQGK